MRAAPGSAALLGQGQELELGAPRQPSGGGGGAGADAARLLAEQREEVQRLFSGFVAQLEALHVRHLDQHGACLQGTAQGRAAPAEAAAPPLREEAPPRAAGRGGAAAAGAPAPPEPSREASWGEVPAALQSFLAGMPRADGWRGQLQDVVHGHAFKSAVTCVIVLGIVAQAFEINDLLERQSEHQGEDDWGLWKFIETAVTVLFVLEVTLRIVADQWYFFLGSARYWNWLDLVLTAMDFFEALLDADGREHRSATIGAVRVFRILRFARVLRAVRLLAAFHSFRVMMLSIVHAMPSLSWAFLLLLVEVYVFSIFFSYGVVEFLREEYLRDGAADSPVASELKLFFGSLAQAMVSLFMCVTGGKDWGYLMHALGACSPVYAAALVVYIFVTLIGVMNVVNGGHGGGSLWTVRRLFPSKTRT
ncbi:unnamed protein product [Prorocentrum cordatum]|uniref:Ion transport domain-containing protein n=1 Tax=Prorocentrum cordatum TaxID=2364126 RepID=A0ABN9RV11_9DINO|nr:unnamed protein product [Polarella glacialis]